MIEDLRAALQDEEFQEAERKKAQIEEENRRQLKAELQRAEQEARDFKLRQKAEEKAMEEIFRRKMLDQFAEDERLEQMNQQKQRMKKLEHQKEVERLWNVKLEMYRKEKEQELAAWRMNKEKEIMDEEIIRREKERLIRENYEYIKDFLPKKLKEEANAFGLK